MEQEIFGVGSELACEQAHLGEFGQNFLLARTSLIGSCWLEALLFQSWDSLLVLFGLGLSIVF